MDWTLWQGSDLEWDAIVSKFPYAQFTQSSAWKYFQESLGREVLRLVIPASTGIQSACQLTHIRKPIGSFWLAQRGPVGEIDSSALPRLAKAVKGGAWFIRLEPVPAMDAHLITMPESLLRRRSHDPSVTRLIDISTDEQSILSHMHQKTRYNIRVAEKHGIMSRVVDSIDAFLLLQRDTAKRDRFEAQSDTYVRKQYEILRACGLATIRIAEKDGKPLAANLLIAYGDTVTYLYGASSSEDRQLMAPYLLHWESILWAKRNGYRFYDLWGVNPLEKTHPDYKKNWEGISRFKAGWGGAVIELPGTYDLPLKSLLYKIGHSIRQI